MVGPLLKSILNIHNFNPMNETHDLSLARDHILARFGIFTVFDLVIYYNIGTLQF
jgi:hypothetical protein